MARPIRVAYRFRAGALNHQASEEKKAAFRQAEKEVARKWKEDPGIRFLCYFATLGTGLDGYAHHLIFEVDDISKAEEMNQDIWTNADLLIEAYSLEVVFGDTGVDSFFQS